MNGSTFHKYRKTAGMAAAGFVGDSPLFVLDYVLRFLRVAVLLSLWRMILAGQGEVSGLTLDTVLTYTLIAEVFAQQLACRTMIDWALWDGSILMHYLQPLGLFGQFAAEMVGRWVFSLAVFSLPLLLAAPLLGVNPLPAGPEAAGLFVVSLVLAMSVGLAIDFIFGSLMVASGLPMFSIYQIRGAVTTLLSGALVPLALLPWGLSEVFAWLPFASTASAPLQIYIGTGEPARLLAVQLGWSIVLWPLAHGLWRINREKMVSYNG